MSLITMGMGPGGAARISPPAGVDAGGYPPQPQSVEGSGFQQDQSEPQGIASTVFTTNADRPQGITGEIIPDGDLQPEQVVTSSFPAAPSCQGIQGASYG